jgi:phosphonate transport system substrate-binding protein
MKKNSKTRKHFCTAFSIFICLITLLLSFIQGCKDDPDIAVVDFSETRHLASLRGGPGREGSFLKVAVGAMTSPTEAFPYYRELLDYIAASHGLKIQLIQRKTSREVNKLLTNGQIDLAFISPGTYTIGENKGGLELLATPQLQGSHFCRACLIVNRDGPLDKLADLKGRDFAFTDPNSNTGKLALLHEK